ncbi:hypothetical protein PFBG_06160, partial [Plasmodium falciparum 7G8]
YGKISYWNERYTNEEEQFDWHQRWYGVKHIFTELEIKNDANILNIGCGTSSLMEFLLLYHMHNQHIKEDYNWDITVKTVQRPMLGIVAPPVDDNLHYIYICKKKHTSK